MKKLLLILLVALTVLTAAIGFCGCFSDPVDSNGTSGGSGSSGSATSSEVTTKLAFKADAPEFFTAGLPVNVSKLIDYETGSALAVTAKYVSAKNEEGEYTVTGVTFTPDKIGKVTITVEIGAEKISKEFIVKVAPPSIVAVREVEVVAGEEIDLKTLVSYVDYTANEEYEVTFAAVSFMPVGGDEEEDKIVFSGDKYTFTALGSFELAFKLVNDGGEAEETMFIFVKRALGKNEINDISNYKRGFFTPTYASGTITYDDADHAENSDWSFMLKADATATAESGGNESEGYWNQFGLIALEKSIDLSKSYIELDLKLSPDARNYVGIGFTDEGQTTVSYHWAAIEKQGEWVHFSMEYKLLEGNFKYIRIATVHPFKSENANYNAGNVWVKIDNVRIKNYEVPVVKNGIIFDRNDSKLNSLKFFVNHDESLNYINQLPWGNNTTFTVSAKVNDAETVLNGYVEEAAPQIFRIENLGVEGGKGTKLEFAKGEKLAVAGNDGIEFFFSAGLTVYFNGERWVNEFVEREVTVTVDMTSTGDYLKVNVKNGSKIDFGENTALSLCVAGKIDGEETSIGGFVEAVNPSLLYLNFPREKGTKLEIAAGAKFVIDGKENVETAFKEAVCIYFDGTNWTKEVVEKDVKNYTLTGITVTEDSVGTGFYFTFTGGEIPSGMTTGANLGRGGNGSGTFLTEGKCGDYSFYDLWTGIIASKDRVSVFVSRIDDATAPVNDGTKIYVPAGSVLTVGEDSFTVGEEISYVWYNGAWIKAEVKTMTGFVISDWSKNASSSETFYIDNTSGTLPSKITNLLYNGLSVYLNGELVADKERLSCYADNPKLFVITGIKASKGWKIEIRQGATLLLDNVVYVFGEEITVYFDGEHWTTEVVTAD